MNDVIAKEDAEVAIRSLARRYKEAVAGPQGDDGWERILRTVPKGHDRSALALVIRAGAVMAAVGQAVAKLPMAAKPILDLHGTQTRIVEPSSSHATDAVLRELINSCEMAAGAVDARRPEDWDRTLIVDGVERTVASAVSAAVQDLVKALREVETTITAATQH